MLYNDTTLYNDVLSSLIWNIEEMATENIPCEDINIVKIDDNKILLWYWCSCYEEEFKFKYQNNCWYLVEGGEEIMLRNNLENPELYKDILTKKYHMFI